MLKNPVGESSALDRILSACKAASFFVVQYEQATAEQVLQLEAWPAAFCQRRATAGVIGDCTITGVTAETITDIKYFFGSGSRLKTGIVVE